MIYDSPFDGWGNKLGGMAYVNWYQPLSDTTRPVGFVNSYLEVAVEHGAQRLFFALVCSCALLLVTVRLRARCWVAAAGACVVAWLVSNVWSSLWFRSGLWILPGVSALCIMIAAFRLKKELIKIMAGALVFGIVITFAILGAGRILAKDAVFRIIPAANGDAALVTLRKAPRSADFQSATAQPPEAETDWKSALQNTDFSNRPRRNCVRPPVELWVDASVMGRYWGRTIRGNLDATARPGEFIIYAPWALRQNRINMETSRRIYSGFQAELAFSSNIHSTGLYWRAELSDAVADRRSMGQGFSEPRSDGGVAELRPPRISKIVILHPTIHPKGQNIKNEPPSDVVVCLPKADASQCNLAWRLWAAEHGAKLVYSPQTGVRIDAKTGEAYWRSLLFDE